MAAAGGGRPPWDTEFPELMDWELDMLRRHAHNVVVDTALLARGVLSVDFDWPLDEDTVALRAVFPPTYPYFRPHVFLRTDSATWPERHVSPLDGGLCLLGRDTAQWQPESYLVELLQSQLTDALAGTGAQDPQAEPAEYWWNQRSLPGSYVLIDSDWDLSAAAHGTLELRYVVDAPVSKDAGAPPRFRAIVARVYDERRSVVAEWTAPLPPLLREARTVNVAWQRLTGTVLPVGDVGPTVRSLRDAHPRTRGPGVPAWAGHQVRPFVFLQDMELSLASRGDGWIVGIEFGRAQSFVPPRGGQRAQPPTHSGVVAVLRAGRADLGVRVPAIGALGGKTVAVLGCGALGAPIAIDLARNGARTLRLLDHDSVEPGNSVRWPLGAPVWGEAKVIALQSFVHAHYPGCTVEPFVQALGSPGNADGANDGEVVDQVFDGVDLVIDASASESVNRLVWQRCQDHGVPLVRLGATPGVKGGTVAVHAVGGACLLCVQQGRIDGSVPRPAGQDDAELMQPAGCGERTFVGADYDLMDLSMQAMRRVVHTLQAPGAATVIDTLHLRDEAGGPIPPRWETTEVLPRAECPCQRAPV